MEKEEKSDEIADNDTKVNNTEEEEVEKKLDAPKATADELPIKSQCGEDTNNVQSTDTDATASDDSQAAEMTTNTKEPKAKLFKKLNSLQEKAKNLREKIGRGFGPKSALKQQEELVQESEVSRRQNDAHAALSMSKIGASIPAPIRVTEVQQSIVADRGGATRKRTETDNSSCCSNEQTRKQKKNQLASQQQQQQAATKEKKKTRNELEEQLQDMRDLLQQLTLQGPLFETKLRQLVQSNKKFKKLDLFTPDSAGANTLCMQAAYSRDTDQKQTKYRNSQMRHDSEQSSVSSIAEKQRQNSITSSSSTVNNSADGLVGTANQGDPLIGNDLVNGKKNRRRHPRRAKKNKVLKAKTQESEQDSLSKYLKSIVQECLGERQADKVEEFAYKPDEEDLETYAQRLVQAGLGRIVEDEIRVNRKNNRQSFITMSNDREGTQRDGIILIPVARRYAFDGDIVRAFVMNTGVGVNNDVQDKPKKNNTTEEPTITGGKDNSFCIDDDELDHITDDAESPDSDVDPNDLDATLMSTSDGCPKAFVIDIVKKSDKREVVGTISFKNATKLNDEQFYYKLKPHDMRVPMVYVPVASCEEQLTSEQKNDICGFLYVVKVLQTDVHGHCIGELDQPVGKVGNLEDEIKAILLHNGLKEIRPYEERFNEMFAQPDAPATAEDLKHREDLRKNCIFTIDPLTARDLDDAMSIEQLDEELYEIGVHISDVAHYLHEDCELDNIVKERATSIYLVNEVIHMLPKPLCFKCSLLPGEDKFAFSVFWRIQLDGEIIGQPRFTRSIISSCTQFAYEHAQKIIDNPKENFDADDFPTICNGYTPDDIAWRVLKMDTIAKCLRAKRYDGGALSINNPKLRFTMNPQSGEPISYEVDGRQDANFLIEEFMLLANQSVARFIHDHCPENAILRNHAPPLSKSLKSLKEKLANLGFNFDFSSSKTIYESMKKICATAKDPAAMEACLNTLLTKPMARAKYFCSEGKTEQSDLWHYALSIPIYTHFTSPIRRYPDILVHRLLAAALNYCPPPKRTSDELHMIAKICNDQKFNAKNAGDESTNLFFKRYIKHKQSITLRAVVTEIFQHLVNVVTIETGHSIGINYKMQKLLVDTSNTPAYILISEKNSKTSPLKLQMFSSVDVKLVIWDDKICGFFASPDPKQRQLNSIEASKKKQQQIGVSNGAIPKIPNYSNGVSRRTRHDSNRDESASENLESVKMNKRRQAKQKADNIDDCYYAI